MGNLEPNISSHRAVNKLFSGVCTTYLVLLMRGWDMTNDVTASLHLISTAISPRQRILFPRGADGCSYRSSLGEYD